MSVQRLRNLWRKVLRMGPAYPVQLILDRLIPSAIFAANGMVIVERNPRDGRPVTRDDPNVRWTRAEDVDLFAKTAYRLEHVRARLQRGDRCAIMEANKDLIGYCWYATDHFEQSDWLRVKVPSGAVWASDIWVAPEFRGQGNDARIKAFASQEFEGVGITKILSMVDVLNRSSLKAHRKIGSRLHGRLFYVRFLGFMWVRVGGSARLGRWHSRRRYELDLKETLAS